MVEVPEVADDQQEDTDISVTGSESKWTLLLTQHFSGTVSGRTTLC